MCKRRALKSFCSAAVRLLPDELDAKTPARIGGRNEPGRQLRRRRMPESAPVHPLPARRLTTLELPYTLSTSTSSHDAAVASLGGTARLSTQLDKCDANDPVEMQLKPADYFAHPVQGDFVKTANLLVKVKKRRRVDGTGERQFMVEPVGVVDCTVRFRSQCGAVRWASSV